MLEEDEIVVLVIGVVAGLVAMAANATSALHPVYFRGNPGIGLVRLAIVGGMAWTGMVLAFFADPSVRGMYVVLYLVLAYAAIKIFGQSAAWLLGLRFRVDVCERRNFASALALAGFILATGVLFGGSLWGEADPDPASTDEGGWWIPLGFFLAAWLGLVLAAGLYLWREPARISLRQRRDPAAGAALAAFFLSCAVVLHEAVAGDFYGWTHGLLAVGAVVAMLIVHEVLQFVRAKFAPSSGAPKPPAWRFAESIFYLLVGGGSWLLHRWIDANFGPGP